MDTTKTGKRAEVLAANWLIAKGLRLIEQNVRTRFFELDLIMEEGELIVFVEVKYRSQAGYGGGVGAITAEKQRRITVGALCWLAERDMFERPVRFDVIEVIGDGPHDKIMHFPDCFMTDI